MQPEIKKLLTFVFSEQEKPSDYQAALNMLSAYIEAELDGQDAATDFPEVKRTLEAYPFLREVYQDMRELLRLERQDALYEPTTKADFDFSYLPKPPLFRRTLRSGREVMELFCQLRLVFSQGQAFFEQLPPSLLPKSEMMPMPSRTQVEEQTIPVLSFPSIEHDLSLRLAVVPPEPEEKEASLVVEVCQASSGHPVPRSRVVLRDDNYRMLESHFTQEDGRVSFTNLSPSAYVLDIKHKGRVWQLPIEVTWKG